MPKSKYIISEVIPLKKHKPNPIIAHFQNGQLSDEFASNLDVCLAKDTQCDNSPPVVLAISKDNAYDGYVGKGFPTDLKRTFLAVRKKDSEEIKLVEVEECSLMSYHYNNCGKKKTDTSNDQSSMSTESARRLLFKEFGGKKAMKVLDRKEKMKINVDVVKDQLDKTLLDINQSGVKEEDEFDRAKEQQDHVLEELVPKMNKEATKLGDVYNLEEIIGSEILNTLTDEAINVLKTSPDDLPIKRAFLSNIIQSIQRSKTPDNPENLLKVKACIYIDALISYFKQVNQVRLNSTVRLQKISPVTTKLDTHIKKKFSQPNVNKLTKTNYVVHKATCYIIVLSLLLAERFEMDIQHIVEEIGISKTGLIKIINGIAVRPKAKSNIVSIRLPSQLKSLTTSFRRRRTL